MDHIVNDERCNATGSRPVHERRQAQFKSGIREAAAATYRHYAGCGSWQERGRGVWRYLPSFNSAEDAFNAVDPVRFGGVALRGNYHPRDRPALHGAKTRLGEYRLDALVHL